MSEQRASVRVVSGHEQGDNIGRQPPVEQTAVEPEAMPPAPPPEQDLQKDIGGPVMPSPSHQAMAEATGGSIADQMRSAFEAMSATEEFTVPGWVRADGTPMLILVARTFGDRRSFNEGLPNEVFIAKSTHQLLWVDEQGVRHEIPGGWGKGLADMLGLDGISKAADLVARVISKPDPSQPGVRIPNVPGIGFLANQIVNWAGSAQSEAEENLGE